jgi:NADH-quinone oxidoreductase subunit C
VAEDNKQTGNVVVERLRGWSPNAVGEVIEFRGETTVVVARNVLRDVAARCREDKELDFNLLSDATCVDRFPMEPRFEVNYHLVSIPRAKRLRLQGHPDLRRILLPDDWEGYPLRKDYPVEGYRDIPSIATRYTRNRP